MAYSFILIIGAIVLIKLLSGMLTLRFKDKLHLVLGFSAGTLLGVAFFDLIPESIEMSSSVFGNHTIMLALIFGFMSYMLIDRLFSLHNHDKCEKESHNGVFSISAIILHSLLDGFSIGLAFQISNILGLSVSLAVLSHSFSDGVNAASISMNNNKDNKKTQYILILNSIAPILGIVFSYFIKISEANLGLILAIFAGLFLYISTNDLLPEAHHKHSSIWTTLSTVFGVAIIVSMVYFFE